MQNGDIIHLLLVQFGSKTVQIRSDLFTSIITLYSSKSRKYQFATTIN